MEDNNYMYLNFYKCPRCNFSWKDKYECAVDDDCSNCGNRHITPYKTEDA